MFANDTCIYVFYACYGNVLSTLQLSADEAFPWATNNFRAIHLQENKIHGHYYVAKTSNNSTIECIHYNK